VDDLSTAVKMAFYQVTQEALHNINEHAHARHASVKLEGDSRRVKLTVRDKGTGFDMDHINRDPNRGFGLRNMQERVEAVGGKLTITSSSEGTKITAIIPRHSKGDPDHGKRKSSNLINSHDRKRGEKEFIGRKLIITS